MPARRRRRVLSVHVTPREVEILDLLAQLASSRPV